MNEDNRPLMVTIRCMTYNQAPYIRQCLDGFVMQKTDFHFEAIVHDDASTDGTADIVREYAEKYPDIIKPIIETENQYSQKNGSLARIMNEHTHGKYIALCEGDDYWIDPLKLQKQVEFLEANPDYGLVHTNRYNRRDDKITKPVASGKSDAISILISTGIATLTVCYRKELHDQYLRDIKPIGKGWLMGDAPLWKYIAFHSKVKLIPDYTGVYRILSESASHSKSIVKRIAFVNSMLDIQKFMMDLYVTDSNQKELVSRKIISNHHLRIFNIYVFFGRLNDARLYLLKHWDEIIKWDLLKISQIRKIASVVVCAPWHAGEKS